MNAHKKNALIVGAAILGALSIAGCATKGDVRAAVDPLDKRITSVDGKVNDQAGVLAKHDARLSDHDARLAGLDKTTREAMERAEAAGKLAEGKFLYSMVLSDDSVKFKTNKSELSPDAQAKLAAFADKLKADNHNVYVEIQGHTDSTGSKAHNVDLGEARADAVRLFLNKQGIALNRLSTISYGSDVPVQPNKTKAGRAANRRVVLIVLA